MELDSLFRLGGDDAVFVIGRDPQGRVGGFLHLAVCSASRSLSLSTMPRLAGHAQRVHRVAHRGGRVVGPPPRIHAQLSLNFSPFAGLLAAQAELPSAQRLQRRALLRLKGVLALQLDNLLRFNGSSCPPGSRAT